MSLDCTPSPPLWQSVPNQMGQLKSKCSIAEPTNAGRGVRWVDSV